MSELGHVKANFIRTLSCTPAMIDFKYTGLDTYIYSTIQKFIETTLKIYFH